MALRSLFFLAVFLFLVFFSPFPNWFASPLYIEPKIEKAQVGLVLSGGSYENKMLSSFSLERTIWAIKLYKKGVISKIIFSGSGGKNQNDAQSMALMAFDLGVKKEDIFIEDDSRSTYENILFSAKIFRENRFKKALLITSPLHQLRAFIIASRVQPSVVFLPATFPSYDRFRRHPLDRLVLFWFTVREYLGIIRENFR